MVLNPLRKDGSTSVINDYIAVNTIIELSSVSVSYARNSVPVATVTVAMGRKNASAFRVAVGHPQIRNIVRQVGVLIEANIESKLSVQADAVVKGDGSISVLPQDAR